MIANVIAAIPNVSSTYDGVLKSTVLLAPQYSGFWKAYLPYEIATHKTDQKELLIQGVLITKDNVVPALKLADDQVHDIQKFPFEKPLTEIVASYK